MSLKQYSKEQLKELSFIEMAYESLKDRKQAISFNEMMQEIADAVELSDEVVRSRIAQFYTDLNIDGRFLSLGENRWGLRVWYPVDQTEEELVTTVKPKKKKAKKVVDDEDFEDVEEDIEDDIEYDDLDDFADDEDELADDEDEEIFEDLDVVDDEEEIIDDEDEFPLEDDEELADDEEEDEEEDL
ncbi:MAG: DNA-directed RNA polymerase subunit delta [Bacillota bacterium]|nr:DNA-directed RNA polymerase subunit delta [Bacillota bacterium]